MKRTLQEIGWIVFCLVIVIIQASFILTVPLIDSAIHLPLFVIMMVLAFQKPWRAVQVLVISGYVYTLFSIYPFAVEMSALSIVLSMMLFLQTRFARFQTVSGAVIQVALATAIFTLMHSSIILVLAQFDLITLDHTHWVALIRDGVILTIVHAMLTFGIGTIVQYIRAVRR